jgi:hypothetical protein
MGLAWQLGLPPGCLLFVERVSDADAVLHVKPRRGQRHYQYEDVSMHQCVWKRVFRWLVPYVLCSPDLVMPVVGSCIAVVDEMIDAEIG